MYKRKLILVVWLAGLALTAPVHADRDRGHGHSGADRACSVGRDYPRHGAFTRGEVRKLKKKRHQLTHLREDYLDDGKLSKKERRKLKRKRAKLRDLAHEFKYNDRTRRNDRGHYHHGSAKRRHGFERYRYYPAYGLSFLFLDY